MKLNAEQMEAAVELLDRRLRERGGPVMARARELCDEELRGVLTAEELAQTWRPETVTPRWRGRERDRPPRRIDYYDPAKLREASDAAHFPDVRKMVEAIDARETGSDSAPATAASAAAAAAAVESAEMVGRLLNLLEPGGRLLRRKVRWHGVRYVLRAGESWRVVRGPGEARLGHPAGAGAVVEWTRGAVIIEREGAVTRIFPEHRKKAMERGRRLVMERPEIEASVLELRRLAMSAAVLLLLLRRPAQSLGNGAAIARAAGVTRAAVSARRVKMEAELEGWREGQKDGGQKDFKSI